MAISNCTSDCESSAGNNLQVPMQESWQRDFVPGTFGTAWGPETEDSASCFWEIGGTGVQ